MDSREGTKARMNVGTQARRHGGAARPSAATMRSGGRPRPPGTSEKSAHFAKKSTVCSTEGMCARYLSVGAVLAVCLIGCAGKRDADVRLSAKDATADDRQPSPPDSWSEGLPDASYDPLAPGTRDITAAKPVAPRDFWEREALKRGWDFKLVDKLVDKRTEPEPFVRPPPPRLPAGAMIMADVPTPDDRNPFPPRVPLPEKVVTVRVGIAASTVRTREKAEVRSAVVPFIDLEQRDYNVRGAVDLWDAAEDIYLGLINPPADNEPAEARGGQQQMAVTHIFDYLLVRAWIGDDSNNGLMPLAWAQPARPHTGELDRNFPGPRGTSVELVVAADSEYRSFVDLKGARLALAARDIWGPGTFLTQLLDGAGQPRDAAFFGSVSLRRYTKDAVLDVVKGRADAACVDQGTIGALNSFYGLGRRLRTIAVSPRYNIDMLYTSMNNLTDYKTEIELTREQLVSLGSTPEGQEVLFFFDLEQWVPYAPGERVDMLAPARAAFKDFISFINDPPTDIRLLLDADAPVDLKVYDRYGDP